MKISGTFLSWILDLVNAPDAFEVQTGAQSPSHPMGRASAIVKTLF